ncbi:hypothetical protein SAPIO_CDS10766 [Scedosporium apiospermum]|uniref:Cytochrome b-c1 complex subunit 8 n=1 Tax=Pseudallescheria apiosperma TaxID=563466 RepID=A0A084FUH6_PSEDA|nr:uncharacterized protein SAPIO_CDS10766 [Scedosporium apiospermum]KEZ38738.1 hypothetical protein SAPIO_CDS10766 [Scedosporium apiospermum]
MQPTPKLNGGAAPLPVGKYGHYLGHFGHFGGQPQKGIITYGLSANRQNPLANTAHDAVFNIWRRFYSQVFFWAPPFVAGYLILDWANKRNHYLNSKAGHAEFGGEEEE